MYSVNNLLMIVFSISFIAFLMGTLGIAISRMYNTYKGIQSFGCCSEDKTSIKHLKDMIYSKDSKIIKVHFLTSILNSFIILHIIDKHSPVYNKVGSAAFYLSYDKDGITYYDYLVYTTFSMYYIHQKHSSNIIDELRIDKEYVEKYTVFSKRYWDLLSEINNRLP